MGRISLGHQPLTSVTSPNYASECYKYIRDMKQFINTDEIWWLVFLGRINKFNSNSFIALSDLIPRYVNTNMLKHPTHCWLKFFVFNWQRYPYNLHTFTSRVLSVFPALPLNWWHLYKQNIVHIFNNRTIWLQLSASFSEKCSYSLL